MRAVVTGAAGQLGSALIAAVPAGVEVIALDRPALDIGDGGAVRAVVARLRPDLVINAAAYTAVDRAETDEAEAQRINGEGPGHLAAACREAGARLIHVSTDFVFDGSASTPYPPDANPATLSAYGRTKLAGERAVGPEALIVRTAWVYAAGGRNFVGTMLRLMAERAEIGVVADQIGSPTHAVSLAAALWRMAAGDARGIVHWTDAGVASWYDFAVAIREEALAAGLLERAAEIRPIATANYPTPAVRPAYAVLDKASGWAAGGSARHWRIELRDAIALWQAPA